MPTGKHVEDRCNLEILARGQQILGQRITSSLSSKVGWTLPLTAAVAGGRAVFAPTLDLEQTSLEGLRFRMIVISPFLDLQLAWSHVVQAKQE